MPVLDRMSTTDVTQRVAQATQANPNGGFTPQSPLPTDTTEPFELSVVMIVKNEGKYIKRCLDSLQLVGYEELIIIDTGCTDNTIKIAKEYPNVKVYEFEWIDDFSAARNFSISKATRSWCMWIDADMYFLEGDAQNLRRILRNRLYQNQYNAFSTMVCNVDTNDGWGLARIWKRSEGFHFTSPVHEVLSDPPGELGKMQLYALNIVVQHDRDGHVGGLEYHDLLVAWYKREPTNQRATFYLAKHFHLMGTQAQDPERQRKLHNRALKFYKKSAELIEGDNSDSGIFLNMANIFYDRHQWKKAIRYAYKAMELDCTYAEPFVLIANCYDELGSMPNAIAMYTIAKSMNRPVHAAKATSYAMYNYVPCINLAQCYLKANAVDLAIKSYMEALEHAGDDQMRETAIAGLRFIYGNYRKVELPNK